MSSEPKARPRGYREPRTILEHVLQDPEFDTDRQLIRRRKVPQPFPGNSEQLRESYTMHRDHPELTPAEAARQLALSLEEYSARLLAYLRQERKRRLGKSQERIATGPSRPPGDS